MIGMNDYTWQEYQDALEEMYGLAVEVTPEFLEDMAREYGAEIVGELFACKH